MNLLIDNDFRDILPPLSKEEYAELEKSVKEKGVLSPILTWNGYIVDGHNRYAICQKNGITTFEVKEMQFGSKDEVLEWILSHQLGRRNLNDFQRNEVALKYQKIIADEMKKRQSMAGGDKKSENAKIASDQMVISGRGTTARKELAKIAGTSEGSIQRSKLIIEHGTQEQIDRARKGGAGNSVSAIAKEIEYELKADEIKTCKKCGKTFPKSEFPPERAICKKCNKKRISEYQGKDFFGNKILIPKEIRVLTEEEIIGDLYNIEKEIEYTVDDLKDEISATIENFHWSISNCLKMHGDLLVDEKSKETVFKEIELLQEKLEGLKRLYGCV